MNPAISRLEKLLAAGRDSPSLRFGLGSEWLKAGDANSAAEHLRRAVELKPDYSAAWKLLARALAESGNISEALTTYRRGIEVAQAHGDHQAAREMTVFARRLERALQGER